MNSAKDLAKTSLILRYGSIDKALLSYLTTSNDELDWSEDEINYFANGTVSFDVEASNKNDQVTYFWQPR